MVKLLNSLVIGLLFTLAFSKVSNSQLPSFEDSAAFLKQVKAKINEPALIRTDHITFPSSFLWQDTVGYFNPPGTNLLYKLLSTDTGLTPIRLDHSIYHGYNFHNYLFWHKGVLYSFGGRGLFNAFFGLTYFDFQNNEW